jgi:cytochrome P450
MSVRVAGLSLDEGLTALVRGDPQVTRNPYPFYRRLREEAPVYRVGPRVFVATHADAKAFFRDERRLVNEIRATTVPAEELSLLSEADRQMYDELLGFEAGYMSRKDGAEHTRIRSAAQPAFTPSRVAKFEEVTQELTDELLDELSREESPDLIELAYRLPLLVTMAMLGAPLEDGSLLKGWGDDMNERRRRFPVPPESIQRAMQGLTKYRTYVGALVDGRRGTPRTDLAAALLAAEKAEQLTRDEVVATCALILFAGHETTMNLIVNGVLALLEHRDQWKLLCDDPLLASSAVEEALRYDAPVQVSLRTAAVDLELNGVEIPAGTSVWLLSGSSNRDPKAFSDPDDLEITRRPNDHLSLGHGVHVCLGGRVARLEAKVVFSTLARRFPGLELAVRRDALPRWTHPSMRGLTSLPVRLRERPTRTAG